MRKRVRDIIRHSMSVLRLHCCGNNKKIFCISMQRTGTTSVGKFFRDFGFRWAGWPTAEKNDWIALWYEGDYEKIFSSIDFKLANAFEDGPWFLPDFYKILYHRYRGAKFILFTRDAEAWFRSMVNHSSGDVIGRSRIHCKVYRRESDYFNLLHTDNIDEKKENKIHGAKQMKLAEHSEHYKEIYRLHNLEVKDFFWRHSPDSLFVGSLEDPQKWQKLGEFLGIHVPHDYDSHENLSKKREPTK